MLLHYGQNVITLLVQKMYYIIGQLLHYRHLLHKIITLLALIKLLALITLSAATSVTGFFLKLYDFRRFYSLTV